MEINKLILALLCAAVGLVAGCTKTDSNSTNNGNTNTTGGTCYLTRQDADSMYTLVTYDAGNNVTSVNTYKTSGNAIVQSTTMEYTGGNMTKISMYDPSNVLTDSRTLTYNADGTVATSDIISPTAGNTYRIEYVYNSSKQITSENFYDVSSTKKLLTYYDFTYDGSGNCTKILGYAAGGILISTNQYTFDNQNAPQAQKFGQYTAPGRIVDPHNPLTYSNTVNGSTTSSSYTYVYNSNGYPTSGTYTYSGSSATFRNTYNCK